MPAAGPRRKYKGGFKIASLKNLINGEWVASTTDDWIDITNPATGEVIAKAPDSTTAVIFANHGPKPGSLNALGMLSSYAVSESNSISCVTVKNCPEAAVRIRCPRAPAAVSMG